jgi:hypothetical protein
MTSSGTTRQAQSPETSNKEGNWFPENLAQITGRLQAIAAQPSAIRSVAVFDFDNTCIFRDVGQAVFRYQLQHLRYRLTPEQLAAILPQTGGTLADRPIPTLTAVLIDTYRILHLLIAAGKQEEAKRLPEYRLFATLLLWFTDQARRNEHLGPRYVLPFMAKMLAGFSTVELRHLAVEVVRTVRVEPLLEETLQVEAPGPIGRIEASYPLGLHVQPEMLALMHTLVTSG